MLGRDELGVRVWMVKHIDFGTRASGDAQRRAHTLWLGQRRTEYNFSSRSWFPRSITRPRSSCRQGIMIGEDTEVVDLSSSGVWWSKGTRVRGVDSRCLGGPTGQGPRWHA